MASGGSEVLVLCMLIFELTSIRVGIESQPVTMVPGKSPIRSSGAAYPIVLAWVFPIENVRLS